jgi:hypothetical protein
MNFDLTKVVQFAEGMTAVEHLFWYDGPVLSHYRDNQNRDWMIVWVDIDHEFNYWSAVLVAEGGMAAYKANEATQFQLLEWAHEIYFCRGEFIDEGSAACGIRVEFKDVPDDHRPSVDSWHTAPGFPNPTEQGL